MTQRKTWMIIACCAGFLSAGCNGGGGGNGGDGAGSAGGAITGSAPVPITSDNAPAVSGAVIDATVGVQDISGFVGTGPLASSNSLAKQGRPDLAKLPGAGGGPAAGGSFKVPIDETFECSTSGSFTISGDVENLDEVNPGDDLSVDFDGCTEFGNLRLDGGFDFLISAIDGNADDILSGRFLLSASVALFAFSVTEEGETGTADGGFDFTVDTTMSPVTFLEFSGDRLTLMDSGDTLTLASFSILSTDDASTFPSTYTYDTSGTIDSDLLAGSVDFVTVTTFVGFGDDYPFAGELVATGADGSSVTVIALDSVNVRLLVDADGDGAFDETIDTTWEEIAG